MGMWIFLLLIILVIMHCDEKDLQSFLYIAPGVEMAENYAPIILNYYCKMLRLISK